VFTNRRDLSASVNGVQLLSEADVVTRILSAGRRLPETEVERVYIALMTACPPMPASATPASVVVSAAPVPSPVAGPEAELAMLSASEVQEAAHAATRRSCFTSCFAGPCGPMVPGYVPAVRGNLRRATRRSRRDDKSRSARSEHNHALSN